MIMGSKLKLEEALRGACVESGWNYAVLWKLRTCPSPAALVWSDGFSVDPADADPGKIPALGGPRPLNRQILSTSLAKMCFEVHNLGEGVLGSAAITGRHRWLFGSSFSQTNASPAWSLQFSAGIQTVAVIPVRGGVLQMGSNHVIPESPKIIARFMMLLASAQPVQDDTQGSARPAAGLPADASALQRQASLAEPVPGVSQIKLNFFSSQSRAGPVEGHMHEQQHRQQQQESEEWQRGGHAQRGSMLQERLKMLQERREQIHRQLLGQRQQQQQLQMQPSLLEQQAEHERLQMPRPQQRLVRLQEQAQRPQQQQWPEHHPVPDFGLGASPGAPALHERMTAIQERKRQILQQQMLLQQQQLNLLEQEQQQQPLQAWQQPLRQQPHFGQVQEGTGHQSQQQFEPEAEQLQGKTPLQIRLEKLRQVRQQQQPSAASKPSENDVRELSSGVPPLGINPLQLHPRLQQQQQQEQQGTSLSAQERTKGREGALTPAKRKADDCLDPRPLACEGGLVPGESGGNTEDRDLQVPARALKASSGSVVRGAGQQEDLGSGKPSGAQQGLGSSADASMVDASLSLECVSDLLFGSGIEQGLEGAERGPGLEGLLLETLVSPRPEVSEEGLPRFDWPPQCFGPAESGAAGAETFDELSQALGIGFSGQISEGSPRGGGTGSGGPSRGQSAPSGHSGGQGGGPAGTCADVLQCLVEPGFAEPGGDAALGRVALQHRRVSRLRVFGELSPSSAQECFAPGPSTPEHSDVLLLSGAKKGLTRGEGEHSADSEVPVEEELGNMVTGAVAEPRPEGAGTGPVDPLSAMEALAVQGARRVVDGLRHRRRATAPDAPQRPDGFEALLEQTKQLEKQPSCDVLAGRGAGSTRCASSQDTPERAVGAEPGLVGSPLAVTSPASSLGPDFNAQSGSPAGDSVLASLDSFLGLTQLSGVSPLTGQDQLASMLLLHRQRQQLLQLRRATSLASYSPGLHAASSFRAASGAGLPSGTGTLNLAESVAAPSAAAAGAAGVAGVGGRLPALSRSQVVATMLLRKKAEESLALKDLTTSQRLAVSMLSGGGQGAGLPGAASAAGSCVGPMEQPQVNLELLRAQCLGTAGAAGSQLTGLQRLQLARQLALRRHLLVRAAAPGGAHRLAASPDNTSEALLGARESSLVQLDQAQAFKALETSLQTQGVGSARLAEPDVPSVGPAQPPRQAPGLPAVTPAVAPRGVHTESRELARSIAATLAPTAAGAAVKREREGEEEGDGEEKGTRKVGALSLLRKGSTSSEARTRPRDRQLIQDRLQELRDILPNATKLSIELLLERAMHRICFLRQATSQQRTLPKLGVPSPESGSTKAGPVTVTLVSPNLFVVQISWASPRPAPLDLGSHLTKMGLVIRKGRLRPSGGSMDDPEDVQPPVLGQFVAESVAPGDAVELAEHLRQGVETMQ